MASQEINDKRGIAVFYELYKGRDPEDESEIVEADDRGLEEFVPMKGIDEAIEHIRNSGSEPSSSEFHKGMWYTSADSTINMQTGDKTDYSYHLKGFSEDEQQIIYKGWKSEIWSDIGATYVAGWLHWFNHLQAKNEYEVRDGKITSPGKFEGCPLIILYLHTCDDWAPLESVDVDGAEMSVFKIMPEEQVFLEIPDDQKYAVTWESDDGFVYGRTMTEEEYIEFPKQSLSAIGSM